MSMKLFCIFFLINCVAIPAHMRQGPVGASLAPKAAPAEPSRPGFVTFGPDGTPKWTEIDTPKEEDKVMEPTYHMMDREEMGEDLKAHQKPHKTL